MSAGSTALIARKSIRARWGRTLAIGFAITAGVITSPSASTSSAYRRRVGSTRATPSMSAIGSAMSTEMGSRASSVSNC